MGNDTYTATGNLSNIEALTDTELAIELAAAKTRFAAARVNDPRRTTLAYTDSKFAVQVFTAEERRRATDTTSDDVEVPGGPCGDACRNALGAHCECACGSVNHGVAHRFGITSKPLPRRNAFAGLPTAVDDVFAAGVSYDDALGAFTSH